MARRVDCVDGVVVAAKAELVTVRANEVRVALLWVARHEGTLITV